MTYRMRGHGEADKQLYVDKNELESWAQRCPVKCYQNELISENILTLKDIDYINKKSSFT